MKHHDRDRTHLSIRASRSVWPFVRLCAWLTLVCCALATVAPAAEEPLSTGSAGEVLPELVEWSELNGGLLLLPRCSDSAKALELAEKTPFIVVACSSQEKQVASLREEAAARGLLARRLYAEQMPDSTCTLAENSVSLLLVDDLAESGLTPDRLEAWLEAISPRRGVAIVGNREAEKLDGRKLLAWASAEGAQVESLAVPGSTFVLIRKPAPEGSDVWTHRFHGPSNQRTSGDTTLKAPFGPAWYALPTNLGYRGDIMVSDGGRAYYIWANRLFYHSVSLICFDIHNGVKLWEQPFKWDKPRDKNQAGYYAGRSCMVAMPDGLVLVDEDRLVILDGENGRELRSIQGPKPGGQIKWLGVEGDLVAVLAGEPDGYIVGTLQQRATNPFGTELAVYRLSDGELVWKRSEPAPVDERELAIFDSRLYAHTRGKWMACRDLRTGEVIWENRDADLLQKLGEEQDCPYATHSYRILVATPEVLYFAAGIRANRVAMDRADGTLLWTEKVGKTRLSLNDIIVGNTLIKHAKRGGAQGTVELKSNKKLDPINAPSQGCGPSFCTADFFITQFGQVTRKGGEILRRGDLKAPCDLGVVIADGVAFSPPSACECNVEIHGYRAFTSVPSEPADDPLPRVSTGPAVDDPLAPQNPEAEWRCWRGDNRRSGSLSVQMPKAAPEIRWQWKPVRANPVPRLSEKFGAPHVDVPSYLPTQAVSADGVAYFGDSQGVLRAVSLEDGRELWNLPVGFKLTVPPALARGRVVAGALDGQVVCLDAKSGRLAWRYRVPERKRRILWYGHLADTRPLIGGALIHGNTVYATAGFSSVDSVKVVALDLADGEPKWTREIAHDDPAGGTLGSLGSMTVAAGQLFIRSGGQVPASFDLETGELTAVPDVQFATLPRHGKDIAAVDEDWILYGGRRVFSDFNRWKRPAKFTQYSLCRTDRDLDGKPNQTVLGVELSMTSALMPVFDEDLFIAFAEYPERRAKPIIKAWKREAFLEAAGGIENKDAKGVKWLQKTLEKAPFVFGELSPNGGDLAESALWTANGHLAYTAALGSDCLIVLHPEGVKDRLNETWQVSAIERTDGTVRWTVPLPGRPVWDGLSLSSDGSILIALWDGSMLCLKQMCIRNGVLMKTTTAHHTQSRTLVALLLLQVTLMCAVCFDRVAAEESTSYIWWEGESFVETNSASPVDPGTPGNSNPEQAKKLSGGKWMTVKPPKDGAACTIQYQLEVPVGKTYNFWVRKFWKHGPFKWRFDREEWRTCGKNIALADRVSLQQFWTVSWVFLGKVELDAGTHTLDIEMIENKGCFDCWLLVDRPVTPRGLSRPGEKSGLAEPGCFAWEPDYDPHKSDCPIDLRHLNEREAGRNGRVRRQGNGFVMGDGKPVRFWIVEGNSLLDMKKSKIDYWARRLAKYGVNMVRVGIIPLYEPYNEGDMEGFERARDKLQYTVAALKKQGIYTYIAHLLRHTRGTIPGEFAGPGYGKRVPPYGLSFFSSQFRDHYMGYVGKTLTAANPYTGLPLAKDPAVAFLEIQNETGLLFWTFDPKKMVPHTRMLIEKAFGDWAAEKHGSIEAALEAWGPQKAPGKPFVDVPAEGRLGLYSAPLLTSMPWAAKNRNPRRASDQLQFIVETQKTFYETMIKRLRQETGLESLIACSNWKTADPKTLGVLERYTYTAGDVICRNVYYSVTHKPKAKLAYTVSEGDTFQGLSTLKAPSMPSPLTIAHVNDYPYMITENAWTQPNRFRTEWPFLVATYGSMMGVDGWDFFSLGDTVWSSKIRRWQVTTPCVFGQFPAAALIFRRGYVKEAANAVTEKLALKGLYAFKGSQFYEMSGTDDMWISRIGDREGGAEGKANQSEPRAFFVGKVNRTVGSEPGKLETVDFAKYIDPQARTVTSMTGQLSWDYGQGVVRVNTPCAQGAGGFLQAGGRLELADVTIESENEYATVLVVSLDGKPLAESEKILIQAATEDKYYGFTTEPKGKFRTVTNSGGYPLNVKEIKTRVTLKGIKGKAVILDANGYPTGNRPECSASGDGLVIKLPADSLYTLLQK